MVVPPQYHLIEYLAIHHYSLTPRSYQPTQFELYERMNTLATAFTSTRYPSYGSIGPTFLLRTHQLLDLHFGYEQLFLFRLYVCRVAM
jgi:hypothetical protein